MDPDTDPYGSVFFVFDLDPDPRNVCGSGSGSRRMNLYLNEIQRKSGSCHFVKLSNLSVCHLHYLLLLSDF